MKSHFGKLFGLFIVLLIIGILYRRFEDKRIEEEESNNNKAIQDFLLDEKSLVESKKPILWIYIPYEYNSRDWLNFGSRSSFDLNQPYLYLTVRSIINKCSDSFNITIIDDKAFYKLLPGWSFNLSGIPDPILGNLRQLALMKILYRYGGLLCPVSFLCMRNLYDLYENGTAGGKMFLCEKLDRNITSTTMYFYPTTTFCGSPKGNATLFALIDFIQRTTSRDYSADVTFLGDFDRWCNSQIRENKMNSINGKYIGVKDFNDNQILLENLMSNQYLKLCDDTYGILIPADELLKRTTFGWFVRSSAKQVLKSDTIIGNYLLLYNTPDNKEPLIEPLETNPGWVAFWRTPLYNGLYGLKPKNLGNNMQKVKYPGR